MQGMITEDAGIYLIKMGYFPAMMISVSDCECERALGEDDFDLILSLCLNSAIECLFLFLGQISTVRDISKVYFSDVVWCQT